MRAMLLTVGCLCVVAMNVRAEDRTEMRVWLAAAPGETGKIGPETVQPPKDEASPTIRVTNVSVPTLTLFQPPKDKANGTCVIVCPGGGYNILAFDKEGTEVAEWLNSIGVTALVLKYRVPRRDQDAPHESPLQDAQRAIRLVRKNAHLWNIKTDRIGILGFSAGGNLAVMAATKWGETTYEPIDDIDKQSCRPDFVIPIYAAYLGDKPNQHKLSDLVRVTERTPPTFMAVTQDDKMRGVHAALLFVELKKAGVPAEVHVYSKGGHGYGLRPSDDPVSTWHNRCAEWMRVSGLLEK